MKGMYVGDNFHYMDGSERYLLGTFATYEDALAGGKEVVDDFLLSNYTPGMTAHELVSGYKMFGEDPWIVPDPESFSAWDYAEERAKEIGSTENAKKPVYSGGAAPSGHSMSEPTVRDYGRAGEEALAYRDLGMTDEALALLESIPPEAGGAYFAAQEQLIGLNLHLNAYQRAADIGLRLVAGGKFTYKVIIDTMLALDFLGRKREACNLLLLVEQTGHALADDAYQLAAFSAQLGEFEDALGWLRVEYGRSDQYRVRSMLDSEFAPLWRFLGAEPLSGEQAHLLLSSSFAEVADEAESFSGELGVDPNDVAVMPEKFRAFLKHHRTGYWYLNFLAASKQPGLSEGYFVWQRSVLRESVRLLRIGIAKAREVALGQQVEYAARHAAAGNHLGVRYHVLLAVAQRPEMLDTFRNEPRLGIARSLLDEIAAAEAIDLKFVSRIQRVNELIERRQHDEAWKLLHEIPRALAETPLYLMRLAGLHDADADYERALPIWEELRRRWPEDAVGFGMPCAP